MEGYAIVWKDKWEYKVRASQLLPEELKNEHDDVWSLLKGEYSVVKYGRTYPFRKLRFESELDMMTYVFQDVIKEYMMKKLYDLGDGCCSRKIIQDHIGWYREKLIEILRTRCNKEEFNMRIFEKDSRFLYKEL